MSSLKIFKLADKFYHKYAQSQSLQEIIANAASHGVEIMNFPQALQRDQAALSINVKINKGTLGGYKVEVSAPRVEPPQFARFYAELPGQIQKYLEKYLDNFPQINLGTSTLTYSGKSQ